MHIVCYNYFSEFSNLGKNINLSGNSSSKTLFCLCGRYFLISPYQQKICWFSRISCTNNFECTNKSSLSWIRILSNLPFKILLLILIMFWILFQCIFLAGWVNFNWNTIAFLALNTHTMHRFIPHDDFCIKKRLLYSNLRIQSNSFT